MNEMIRRESIPAQAEVKAIVVNEKPYERVLDEEHAGGIFGETLAWIKDDRANTMRAISSDAASRKMVQKQNYEVLMACNALLQRKDLTVEQRLGLIDRMSGATASAERVDTESRAFQHEQLSHSHKWSGRLLIFVIAVMLGVGGTAWNLNRAA